MVAPDLLGETHELSLGIVNIATVLSRAAKPTPRDKPSTLWEVSPVAAAAAARRPTASQKAPPPPTRLSKTVVPTLLEPF